MLSLTNLVHQEGPKFPVPSILGTGNPDHLACAQFLSALAAPMIPLNFGNPSFSFPVKAEKPENVTNAKTGATKADVSWLLNEEDAASSKASADPSPWFQPTGPKCKREETFGTHTQRAAYECSRSPSPGAHPVAPQMSPPLSHASSKGWHEEAASHGPMGPRSPSACGSSADEDQEGKKQWTISLDAELAAYIYQIRPRNAGSRYGSMAEAARIGSMHGVSPKTIRDIWNRKSWVKATRKLWTAEEAAAFVPRRHRRSSTATADPRDKKRARVDAE